MQGESSVRVTEDPMWQVIWGLQVLGGQIFYMKGVSQYPTYQIVIETKTDN